MAKPNYKRKLTEIIQKVDKKLRNKEDDEKSFINLLKKVYITKYSLSIIYQLLNDQSKHLFKLDKNEQRNHNKNITKWENIKLGKDNPYFNTPKERAKFITSGFSASKEESMIKSLTTTQNKMLNSILNEYEDILRDKEYGNLTKNDYELVRRFLKETMILIAESYNEEEKRDRYKIDLEKELLDLKNYLYPISNEEANFSKFWKKTRIRIILKKPLTRFRYLD